MQGKRKWHTPEQVVKKLREADAKLSAGKNEALQTMEFREVSLNRWQSQCGATKSEEATRLKSFEEENRRGAQRSGVDPEARNLASHFERLERAAHESADRFRAVLFDPAQSSRPVWNGPVIRKRLRLQVVLRTLPPGIGVNTRNGVR